MSRAVRQKAEESANLSQLSSLALHLFCIWHGLVKGGGKPSIIGSLLSLLAPPPQCMYTQAGTRRDSLDGGCFFVWFFFVSLIRKNLVTSLSDVCGGVAQSFLLNLP